MRASDWTDAEKAHLKRRWLDGASVTEIARELKPRSRNAVIGAAHRMNLPQHAYQEQRAAIGRQPRQRSKPRQYKPRHYPQYHPAPLDIITPFGEQPKIAKMNIHPGNIARKAASRAHDPGLKPKLFIAPSTEPVLLIEAEAHHCRYIAADEPSGPDTLVCGAPVEGNGSWCSAHMETVFQPEHRRREWAA